MTVGVDEGFWYVVLHPEKYEFEAKNLGTLQQVEEVQILILHFVRMFY